MTETDLHDLHDLHADATGRRECLWELLWRYDPNGLIVVDDHYQVKIVNPAFCRMFGVTEEVMLGADASRLLGDMTDFRRAWEENETIRAVKEYPAVNLYVRKLLFAVKEEGIIACVMVDLTEEWNHEREMSKLQRETLTKVQEVVDNQMKVAQQIAGLLGETTAETKVSLLKLVQMIEEENAAGGQLP